MFTASNSRHPAEGVRRRASVPSGDLGVGATFFATLLIASQPLAAQPDTTMRIDGRWRPYIGCWASYTEDVRGADLCLVPTRDSETVVMILLTRGAVTSQVAITANGQRTFRTRGDCAGWDSARWSLDERRLYVHTEYTCASGLTQASTGIVALKSANLFARVDQARADQSAALRTVTYAAIPLAEGLPDALALRLPARDDAATLAARIQSSAFVSTADVADASRALDAPVVEAWLADRGHVYPLTRDDVRGLRDAAVPAGVIDVMLRGSHRALFASKTDGSRHRRARTKVPAPAASPAPTPFFHGIRAGEFPQFSAGGVPLDAKFPPPVRVDVDLGRIP